MPSHELRGAPAPFPAFGNLLRSATAHFQPQFVAATKQHLDLPLGHEMAAFRAATKRTTAGEEKEASIRALLDNLGYERNVLQVEMHNHALTALLPQIYGQEYDRNYETILKRKNIDRHYSDVVMRTFGAALALFASRADAAVLARSWWARRGTVTARRMGKTYGTAMLATALLCELEAFEIIVFSVSMDTAIKMIDLVRSMIPAHMWAFKETNSLTQISFRVRGDKHNRLRSITALAGTNKVRASPLARRRRRGKRCIWRAARVDGMQSCVRQGQRQPWRRSGGARLSTTRQTMRS
jgi:hypothetical protein